MRRCSASSDFMKSSADAKTIADPGGARAARIAAFLDAHHVMSVATCGPNGPHAASLFYARDGFDLIWVSDPKSEHSRHVAERARIAVTIARDYGDFPEIKGLQIAGDAHRLADGADSARARSCLEARYPFLRDANASPALREAYDKARFYRLVPARIVFIDNSRGLGFKETLEFANPRP